MNDFVWCRKSLGLPGEATCLPSLGSAKSPCQRRAIPSWSCYLLSGSTRRRHLFATRRTPIRSQGPPPAVFPCPCPVRVSVPASVAGQEREGTPRASCRLDSPPAYPKKVALVGLFSSTLHLLLYLILTTTNPFVVCSVFLSASRASLSLFQGSRPRSLANLF